MPVRKLTARYVEAAKAIAGRLEIRDTQVRGLEFRVSISNKKVWAFRYRRRSDRAQRTLTLGDYPAYSLEQARQWALQMQAAVARGVDPAAQRDERKVAATFSDLAAEWIERHGKPNKSPRALRDDLSMLERHILPEIGSLKIIEIRKRDVICLLDNVTTKLDARVRKNTGSRRLTHRPNRVFELVRSIFRWAVNRDLISDDPTLGLSQPIKKEYPRERVLSVDEIQIFWAALQRAPMSRLLTSNCNTLPMTRATALALALAFVTAQRIGEICGIAISELDLNESTPTWTVPGARSKNGEPNRVPLSPLAVQLIHEAQEIASGAPRLFPSPTGDGPMSAHAPTRALHRARPMIGLPDFRVHDLRRTAATQMAELGISPHTISVVLNHVSARRGTITGRAYNHYSYDREKRDALNAWGQCLEQLVQGANGMPLGIKAGNAAA